jgi:hypothetical protein
MIKSSGSLFAGHVDLEQKGLDGTSVNERCRGVSLRLVIILMPRKRASQFQGTSFVRRYQLPPR